MWCLMVTLGSIAHPFFSAPRHLSDSSIIEGELADLGYLPAGLRVSVVAEILRYPVVDGGESHFGLFAGLHGHADERGVGIGRFDFRVGFVVDLHRRAGLDGDLWVAGTRMCAIGELRCCGGVAAGGDGAKYSAGDLHCRPHEMTHCRCGNRASVFLRLRSEEVYLDCFSQWTVLLRLCVWTTPELHGSEK